MQKIPILLELENFSKVFPRIQANQLNFLSRESENRFEDCVLSIMSGTLLSNEIIKDCIIQILVGPDSQVLNLAYNQLSAFESVLNSQKVTDVLGYEIEIVDESLIKYVVVKPKYLRSIQSALSFNIEEKIDLIYQIISFKDFLEKNYLFLGAITQNLVFLDESNKIKFDIPICAKKSIECCDISLPDYFNVMNLLNISLLDQKFFAPEVILAKNIEEIGTQGRISPLHADLYSLGCLAYWLLGFELNEYIFRHLPIMNFPLAIINKNEGSLKRSLNDYFRDTRRLIIKNEHKIMVNLMSIENPSVSIERYDPIVEFVVNALKTYTDERKFINSPMTPIIGNPDAANTGGENFYLELRVLVYLILNNILEKKYDDAKQLISDTLEIYEVKFHESFDRFFSTKCNGKVLPIYDGIIMFFWNFLYSLSKSTLDDEIFIDLNNNLIESPLSVTRFANFFDDCIHWDFVKTTFILHALFTMNIGTDWKMFFSLNYHQKLKLIKFSDIPNLKNSFLTLITKRTIRDAFVNNTLPPEKVETEVPKFLEKVYITQLPPCQNGLTTYNLYIFLNCTDANLEYLDSISFPVYRAIIFIILLHELGHALRRLGAETLKESRYMYTPKKSQVDHRLVFPDNYETEDQLKALRGEGGFKIEKYIFGKKVKKINKYAAEYLINFDGNTAIGEFRENFNRELKRPGGKYSVERGSSLFHLEPICGFSGKSRY